MFYLVDMQYHKVVGMIGKTNILFGVYCDTNNTLSYYKESELIKFLKTQKVNGVKCQYDTILEVTISQIEGITFVTNNNVVGNSNSYRRIKNAYIHQTEGKFSEFFKFGVETVYLKAMNVTRFVEGVTFWYRGLLFEYKYDYLQQRKEGFNLVTSIPWKKTKNYFSTNSVYILTTEMQVALTNKLWCDYMTNNSFAESFNDFQKYYKVTSFYRTALPYCKDLDLANVKLDNIVSLRGFLNGSKSIQSVNIGSLSLSNIREIYQPFKNTELSYIDFSNGLYDITDKLDPLLFDLTTLINKNVIVIVLNQRQCNLAHLIQMSGNFLGLGTFETNQKNVILQSVTLKGAKAVLMGRSPQGFVAIVK